MWVLTTHLLVNDQYAHNVTKWRSFEGAFADMERQQKPRRIKDKNSPTGYKTIWPIGWSAITSERERGNAERS